MKLLVLTPRFPYPPIKGDKLRPYHLIRYLSKYHEIILISIIESHNDEKWLNELKPYCKQIETFVMSPFQSKIKCLKSFITGLPLQVEYYYSTNLQYKIQRIINEEKPDLLYAVLIRTSIYFQNISIPKVVDFIDAISLNYQNDWKRDNNILNLWKKYESLKLKTFEKKMLTLYDHAFITTQIDKEAIENSDKITVSPVGVELDDFKFTFNENCKNKILLSGNMEYAPNVDAAVYFAKTIFPYIRKEISDAEFIIAGAAPLQKVKDLSKINGIKVLGYVDNMNNILLKAGVYVCPMRFGAGIKIKLLEAMSTGIPIVSTSIGCEGIGVKSSEHLLIADDPKEFAQKVILLLKNRQIGMELSVKARSFIESNYQWNRVAKDLNNTLNQVVDQARKL